MKRLPWKYLAGFVDADGCIDVNVSKYFSVKDQAHRWHVQPRLRVSQRASAVTVLDMLQNSCGGNRTLRPGKGTHEDHISIEFTGYKQSCQVLRNIVKHLILKKEQARLCLWMETNLKGKQVSAEARDAVREELKLMKRDPHRLSEMAQERIFSLM